MTAHRFGTATLVGRANVGKSTLLNALVGERLAIVTPKAQTTRNRIAGIRTLPGAQLVLLDTPGVVAGDTRLNRRLRRIAEEARAEADVVVLVVDVGRSLGGAERDLLAAADPARTVVALTKIDAGRKSRALPLLEALARLAPAVPGVPVSGRDGTQVDALLDEIVARLPPGAAMFAPDDYTTASTRFLAQELLREQVFRQARDEVPYGTAVVVESMATEGGLTRVEATILVSREAHRGMLVGAGGGRVKSIGRAARAAIETLLGGRVHLELRVRLEEDWLARPERLQALELT